MYKKVLPCSSMQLRSLISCSVAQSLTLHKAGKNEIQSRVLQVTNRNVGCRVVSASTFEQKLVRDLARKFAWKFGHDTFATKCCGECWPHKFTQIRGPYCGTSAVNWNRTRWGSVNLGVLWGGSKPQCLPMPASLLSFCTSTCGVKATFGICLSSSTIGCEKQT